MVKPGFDPRLSSSNFTSLCITLCCQELSYSNLSSNVTISERSSFYISSFIIFFTFLKRLAPLINYERLFQLEKKKFFAIFSKSNLGEILLKQEKKKKEMKQNYTFSLSFTERLRGVGADSKGQVCTPNHHHAPWSHQMLTIKRLWKIPHKQPFRHVGEADIQSLKCQHGECGLS